MSHKLNYNDKTGQHSFFSVQEKAWHRLGQIVKDYPTSAEAIKHAGLDYTVEKRKLFTLDNESNLENPDETIVVPEIEVTNFFATMRTDTEQVLGVVGKDYQIVQNVDAFSFFDAIVGGDGIQYETAGALGKGERIFITAKLPGYIKVGDNDLIEKYLFLTTSHNGFGSITAAFTPTRIVCNNTLNAALRNCSNAIKIRHTVNAKDRLAEAHRVMGISNMLTTQLDDIFNKWSKVRITDQQVQRLIELAMVPNKEVLQNLREGKMDELSTAFQNVCNTVYEYGMTAPSQQTETAKGTVFGAYNAVTGYYQNLRSFKTAEAKLKSLFFGGTAEKRAQKAFTLCESFIKRGEDALIFN